MRSLADFQDAFARAMTTGEGGGLVPEFVGGTRAAGRLAIHLRHYAASLTEALSGKFPACAWLLGADFVRDAARDFARAHPPARPCIAEYGRDFPRFLASRVRTRALPWLESFAELEWAAGQVSIATDRPPLSWEELARRGPERLLCSAILLQPGLRYLRSRWRIDELMQLYLGGREPERFVLEETDRHIEVRGARGSLAITALEPAAFAFRAALVANRPLGEAAERALEIDGTFDAGQALRRLADPGLVAGCEFIEEENRS